MKTEKAQKLKDHIAALERKLFEAKAQYASTLGAAFDAMPKASEYMGSGVIVQISALGGKEIAPAFLIRDGLSAASVRSLQDDISRSFELATMVNPAMVRS